MCAARVPVAPAVGAVPLNLWLVPQWHRVRCDVLVRCMCNSLAVGLPFVARVALLDWVGGLTIIVCVCLWWFPALLHACLCIPNHRVSVTRNQGGHHAFLRLMTSLLSGTHTYTLHDNFAFCSIDSSTPGATCCLPTRRRPALSLRENTGH